MRSIRTAILALMVPASVALAAAGIAMAIAPPNDTIEGATPIPGIPFSDEVDTSEATTDANDAQANELCGAPATDASVWYSLSVAEDMLLLIDVSTSDYTAGVIVATGEPGNLEAVACGPGAILFDAAAGEQYFILAFDDQFDGGGNGGTLRISITEAPPAPVVDLTVDSIATFDPQTGTATLSGTLRCEGEADFVGVSGSLTQQVGRFAVNGFFFVEGLSCDGTEQEWTAVVTTDSGAKFKGGKATANVSAFACNISGCGEAFVEQEVRLRR